MSHVTHKSHILTTLIDALEYITLSQIISSADTSLERHKTCNQQVKRNDRLFAYFAIATQ